MDGTSYRHIAPRTWKPEQKYLDIKTNLSAGGRLIRANDRFFGIPWSTSGGSLGVFEIGKYGKNPAVKLIRGHSAPIGSFDFSPFHDNLLATGSREPTVKVWKIPDEGLRQDLTEPISSFEADSKRITHLSFHPSASNILLTSGGDFKTKIWDVSAVGKPCLIELEGHKDVVVSSEWNYASTLITSSRDNQLRLFDVRASKTPKVTITPHESSKGFEVAWLGMSERNMSSASIPSYQLLATVGFSKTSERQLCVWDVRNMKTAACTQTIDVASSSLIPFYDPGTGLLYLSEKGNRIYVYETSQKAPWATQVCKFQVPYTFSGACMLPKRMVDVKSTEVARFMLVGPEWADTVSFHVPRKDNSLYHEDLYAPVPSSEPSMTSAEWIAKKDLPPKMISLQPPGMKSIYDISEEEGGRSRIKDEAKVGAALNQASSSDNSAIKLPNEIKEGNMQYGDQGILWTSWEPVYATIKSHALCLFENQASAKAVKSVEFAQLVDIRSVPDEPYEITIVVSGQAKPVKLRLASIPERDLWIRCIKEASNQYKAKHDQKRACVEDGTIATSKDSSSSANEEFLKIQGYLNKYTEGFFFNTWQKSYFVVSQVDAVLRSFPSESNQQLKEELHLDKVSSIYEASHLGEGHSNYFNMITPTRTWILQAQNQTEMQNWIVTLKKIMKKVKRRDAQMNQNASSSNAADLTGDDDEIIVTGKGSVVEGWVSTKVGSWSLWSRMWLTAAGSDLLFFPKPTVLEPTFRLQLASAQSIDLSPGGDSQLEFEIKLQNGKIHHFYCPTTEERDEWLESLRELRIDAMASADIAHTFNITKAEVDKELTKDLEASLKNVIDPTLLKNGQGNPILISIIGKRRVRATIVPTTINSFIQDAVFILDTGLVIYQWNGIKSSRMHKAKALDLVTKIRTKERNNTAKIIVINQGVTDEETAANTANFWKILGASSNRHVVSQVGSQVQSDESVKLYRIFNEKISCVHQGRPPSKDKLHSKYVFVVDCGPELHIWNGKSSTKESKKFGLKLLNRLQEYKIKMKMFFVVSRQVENGETSLWKEKFSDYPSTLPISMNKPTIVSNVRSRREQPPIDVNMMFNEKDPIGQLYDDGNGTLKIWKVEEFEKMEMPVSSYGQFYSGNSFLILYTYKEGNSEKLLLYFWQGRDSSIQEKGTSAYLTKELDDDLRGMAKQIRVVQNQEPQHFLLIFKNKYCVHMGDYQPGSSQGIIEAGSALVTVATPSGGMTPSPSSSDGLKASTYHAPDNHVRYYDIRGSTTTNVHARETTLEDMSLNQNHVTLIVYRNGNTKEITIWHGKFCNNYEKQFAQSMASRLFEDFSVTVVEGTKEPTDFWSKFKGLEARALPPTTIFDEQSAIQQQIWPKLFCFSSATGVVLAERIWSCDQDSLDKRYVMVLDARDMIWVWFGPLSKVNEQKIAMQSALEYAMKYSSTGAVPSVWVTKMVHEPLQFTSQFHGWSTTKLIKEANMSNPQKVLSKGSAATQTTAFQKPVEELLKDYLREIYPYSELLADPLPVGVDPKRLEQYITADEFESVFKMTREEYDKLPSWKQENLKKSVGLY